MALGNLHMVDEREAVEGGTSANDPAQQFEALVDLVDGLRDAVIVLDGEDRLLVANAGARALLEAGDALELDAEHRVIAPRCEPPLPALLGSHQGTGVIERRDGRPLIVRVRRRGERWTELWLVADGNDATVPDPRWLALAYGLTQAELRVVARVAEGQRPDAIAKSLGVSVGTVRNQLKQAFAKTRVNSQSALVALVLTHEPRLRRLKRSGDGRC